MPSARTSKPGPPGRTSQLAEASHRSAAATAEDHAEPGDQDREPNRLTSTRHVSNAWRADRSGSGPHCRAGSVPTPDSSATEEEYRMSPQHHTPGANAEAAAARAEAEEAGSPPKPSATSGTDESAPSPAAGPGTKPAATPEAESTAAPEAESGAAPEAESTGAPAGEAPAAPQSSPRAAEEPEGRAAVAAAVAAPPGVKADTGVSTGRPRKPVLAGAAIAGAVLIAIPLLLAGSANDERPDAAKGLAADADTVLNASSAPAALDDYVAEKPSSSPSKAKPKMPEAPKVAVAQPAASPSAEPEASSSPEKKKPKTESKPKASAKPSWGTKTVYATGVLQAQQAWSTNRIRMVMQSDGNLVVYNEKNKPVWASMTFGSNHRAIFQQDGNLVIHNGDDRPIWASRSHGHENAQLVLRADGKVVILHNGGVIWST